MRTLKIGLFGIGLDAYWPQFTGLKERLHSYLDKVAVKLGRPDVDVVNLGLIDNPEAAMEAGHRFRQADVDLIFLHVTTYALSSTVLPVVRRARVPVLILNLQPGPAIDYDRFIGKVGRGLSVEMSVKHGPITLLSVVQAADGRIELLVAEGESVPGPILEIGNTNSRYRFPGGVREFVAEWSRHGLAHHCAVAVGRLAGRLDRLGRLLGLRTVRVC
jgi:L-arabinose isomerase